MGLPSSFLQLSHGDPTLLAQQEGSRWEWPGCLTWAHPYILTTNKSDHETSAGLGWAGRRGGVPKTEALGTALGSNPRPATYWLCGCVTVGRSHGFFKPATVSSSVKQVCDFSFTRSLRGGLQSSAWHMVNRHQATLHISQTGHLRLRGKQGLVTGHTAQALHNPVTIPL